MTNPLTKGIIVYPREIDFPSARFLSKEKIIDYQSRIRAEYRDNPNALKSLDVISFDNNSMEPLGSNFWAVAELDSMGIPIASISLLNRLAETNPDALSGHYEDIVSLVLRSPKDESYKSNNLIIDNLIPQLKKRAKKRNIQYPVLISGNITPILNSTDYGLTAKLGDKTKIYFNVGELSYANNQKKFNIVDEREVPIFDENGARTFYAKDSGLSRLCLYGSLDLGSRYVDLASSYSDGRVVVVNAEGTAQNLDNYVAELSKEKLKQEKALKERFDTTFSILRKK